jgi:hypothetical protein
MGVGWYGYRAAESAHQNQDRTTQEALGIFGMPLMSRMMG